MTSIRGSPAAAACGYPSRIVGAVVGDDDQPPVVVVLVAELRDEPLGDRLLVACGSKNRDVRPLVRARTPADAVDG